MSNKNEKIVPVLLGGDLNAYSVAKSFYGKYGTVSEVFARERLAITDLSSYINIHAVPGLDDPNVAVPELLSFAKSRPNEKLLLVPCADWYVEMLEYATDALTGHFYFNIPKFELWRAVSDKSSFTRLMDKYGIPHPKTEIFDDKFTDLQKRCIKMRPPFVLKPADSSEYWRNPFPDMKKVYFTFSLDEAKRIGEKIFSSGYSGKLLVEEYVGDTVGKGKATASTLTVYMNRRARPVRAVLGDVLLEERGPTARGNYSAIVTRELDPLCYSLISMLENIKYTGVANFDILTADGVSYCLELNPRQGRSCDYLRCAGVSLAELFVSDMRAENIETDFKYGDGVWRCVGRRTVEKYSTETALLKKAISLEKKGASVSAYDFHPSFDLKERIYTFIHMYREEKRYKRCSRNENSAL